jgi:hypothetical protein
MMRFVITLAVAGLWAGGAFADDTCKAQADAKKLAGAAQTSFMTKCQKTAKTKCDTDAKGKNLHGAAANSFVTKCVNDAVGSST